MPEKDSSWHKAFGSQDVPYSNLEKHGGTVRGKGMLKVLVAEHDEDLNVLIDTVLRQEGYEVLRSDEGTATLKLLEEEKPDFFIVDRMIPPMGGIRICKWLRMVPALADIPVIMLSAREDVSERILALDAGADDYMVRPFDMEELLARIKALQRRHPTGKSSRILKAGDIEMNLDRWVVSIAGVPVNLTVKEYRLLQELLEAKGRVLSRDTLLERVWGHEKGLDIHTRTVDVHMSRLRTKLGPSGNYIITVRNIGYRIDITPDWINH